MQDPLFQLQREIDRVFEDVFTGGGGSSGSAGGRSGSTMMRAAHRPADSEGELRLHADLPGVQPSDLDIRVEGDVVTIRGERKSENERNEQNFHVMERSHGASSAASSCRSHPNPDDVQATVREGVLEVRIPKRAPQERSRRIEVRGGESADGQSMTGAISGAQRLGIDGRRRSGSRSVGGRRRRRAAQRASGGSGSLGRHGIGRAACARRAARGRRAAARLVGEPAADRSGGMAGTSGGPTAAPAGETAAKR